VTFTIDADGLLGVTAREQGTGVEAHIQVKPSYGLSDDEIARMLKESFATAEADMQARALTEARVDAERMVLATQSALAADGQLLQPEERSAIDALVESARATAQSSEDAAEVEAAVQALAKGTEAFAAMRMNEGIRKALAGRNLESI
jgi:molecular chaperone HscA